MTDKPNDLDAIPTLDEFRAIIETDPDSMYFRWRDEVERLRGELTTAEITAGNLLVSEFELRSERDAALARIAAASAVIEDCPGVSDYASDIEVTKFSDNDIDQRVEASLAQTAAQHTYKIWPSGGRFKFEVRYCDIYSSSGSAATYENAEAIARKQIAERVEASRGSLQAQMAPTIRYKP